MTRVMKSVVSCSRGALITGQQTHKAVIQQHQRLSEENAHKALYDPHMVSLLHGIIHLSKTCWQACCQILRLQPTLFEILFNSPA